MENTSPESPDDMRKRAENAAREAILIASGADNEIITRVIQILLMTAQLAPQLPRLKEIVENPNHPLFVTAEAGVDAKIKEHYSMMRRAQVGAIVRLLQVCLQTQVQTEKAFPKLDSDANID